MKNTYDKTIFARNFKKIRKEHGLSVTEVARDLGVSRQTIYNYESADSFPIGSDLFDCAKVLNCKVTDFFREKK